MTSHRILVCGGRNFNNWIALEAILDEFKSISTIECIITGDAPGADACARIWATRSGIEKQVFAARWDDYSRAAGPLRNQEMLDQGKPTMAIVAPGGRGTKDMLTRLKKSKVRVWLV